MSFRSARSTIRLCAAVLKRSFMLSIRARNLFSLARRRVSRCRRRGGAHQSTVTPSLGAEIPRLNAYEPCFAQEVEWILLDALRQCCDREAGRSTYLRLSTKLIDQALLTPALERLGANELQRQVLAGGYRLVDWRNVEPVVPRERLVHIATTGVMMPEAIEAAEVLREHRVAANVLNMTSPRRLFEAWQTMQQAPGYGRGTDAAPTSEGSTPFDWLIPTNERHAPIVTIHDGASHALLLAGECLWGVGYPARCG